MTEKEEALLKEYFEINFSDVLSIYRGYENISDSGRKYVYDSFGFKWYVLHCYCRELKTQIVDALKFWK